MPTRRHASATEIAPNDPTAAALIRDANKANSLLALADTLEDNGAPPAEVEGLREMAERDWRAARG